MSKVKVNLTQAFEENEKQQQNTHTPETVESAPATACYCS